MDRCRGTRDRRAAIVAIGLLLAIGPSGSDAAAQPGSEPGDQEASAETSAALGPFAVSFGGQYRVVAIAGDLEFHQPRIIAEQPTVSLINQRLRPWVTFTDRDSRRRGAYLQLEIGHTQWGTDLEFPKTNAANGAEVGIELRRGYLWLKPTNDSLLRVGVLDWHDRFGERPRFEDPQWAVDAYDSFRSVLANSIWDFEVGGATFDATLAETWHIGLGALLLEQQGRTAGGDGAALLLSGDVDREVGSALLGASIYYLHDDGTYSYGTFGGPRARYDSSWDLWAGARGHFQVGRLEPSFFLIVNTGRTRRPDWRHTGWAAKGATSAPVAGGTVSLQALYSTGDDGTSATRSGEFRTIAQSVRDDFGAQGYWSLLGLTSPRGPSDVIDLGVGLQNRGLGLVTLQVAFERALSERATAYLAAGYLRSAERNPESGSTAMGAELLAELHWSLGPAMGVDVGGSFATTGDFYRAGRTTQAAANLYQLYTRYLLEF